MRFSNTVTRRSLGLAACVALVMQALSAQTTSFRGRADFVPLSVAVYGKDGRPIDGLRADNFKLSIDGDATPVALFAAGPHPINVAVVLDLNIGMSAGAGLARSFAAADGLLGALGPDDRATVGSINQQLGVITTDMRELRDVLKIQYWDNLMAARTQPVAGLDWAIAAVEPLDAPGIIALFTDGAGYRSTAAAADEFAKRSTLANISLHVFTFEDTHVDQDFIATIKAAGAETAIFTRDADLPAIFRGLVDEWHRTYLLGFKPEASDGKRHRISVKVGRKDVTVFARTHYVAPKRNF